MKVFTIFFAVIFAAVAIAAPVNDKFEARSDAAAEQTEA